MRAAIVGASGYVGGEVLRLLARHPSVEHIVATSDKYNGLPVHVVHPNLRGVLDNKFVRHDDHGGADTIFSALPPTQARRRLSSWLQSANKIIDMSPDFRPGVDGSSGAGDDVSQFALGIPELFRDQIRMARCVSIPGCMAIPGILALYPLVRDQIVASIRVLVDGRTGSSGAGREVSLSSHHPERSGALRIYSVNHRHGNEIGSVCGIDVDMVATAVEAVRGVQTVVHIYTDTPTEESDIWQSYRNAYAEEPFVRLTVTTRGIYRFPEPKILAGTNFCDLGFALSQDQLHLVLIGAVDNLMKGGAGSAIQCFNVQNGFHETAGLEFVGLHPV